MKFQCSCPFSGSAWYRRDR